MVRIMVKKVGVQKSGNGLWAFNEKESVPTKRPDSAVLHHQFCIAVGVKLLRSTCIHFYGFLSFLNSALICVPHVFRAIFCLFAFVLLLF